MRSRRGAWGVEEGGEEGRSGGDGDQPRATGNDGCAHGNLGGRTVETNVLPRNPPRETPASSPRDQRLTGSIRQNAIPPGC